MRNKPLSGGARLIASGKHPVLLGLSPDDRTFLLDAAKLDGRPLTQFLIYHGLRAAATILKKNRNSA